MNQNLKNPFDKRAVVAKAHELASGVSGAEAAMGDIGLFVQTRLNHGLMMDGMARCLSAYDLSPISYMTMMMLYGLPDNIANPSDICTVTGETRGNMTRICDELVSKGWVRRVPSETDRRRVDLSLTDEGIALLQVVVPVLRKRAEVVFSVFSPEEKAMFSGLMSRMQRSLESLDKS